MLGSLHSKETEFYIDVTEVPPQSSSGVLENNCASFQSDVNIFWNVNSLMRIIFVLTVEVAKIVSDLF